MAYAEPLSSDWTGTQRLANGGTCSRRACARPRATGRWTAASPLRRAGRSRARAWPRTPQTDAARPASTCATCLWWVSDRMDPAGDRLHVCVGSGHRDQTLLDACKEMCPLHFIRCLLRDVGSITLHNRLIRR